MNTLEKYVYHALDEIGVKNSPDAKLLQDSAISSIALVNLLMFLQEALEDDGVQIDWSTAQAFGSKSPFLNATSLARFIDEQASNVNHGD